MIASSRVLLALPLVMAGCAGPPQAQPSAPQLAPLAATPRPVLVPAKPPPAAPGLGPEILVPAQDSVDAEVARVGDIVLRQSHVYERLLNLRPRDALLGVDLLVTDVMVAHHAAQFGIRVQVERVEQLAEAEVQQIRRELAEGGGGTDFGAYVWKVFGMREADWQETRRRRIAKQLYLGYVIRYLALREDRVHIRFLVHKDEQIAREVADKVRAGADFATLALRHSEDPSRRDGGLLPPFGRGFEHPVATAAFTLQSGEVSAPFRARWGDGERWFVVYCLERLPGRDLPFAAVATEIDKGLVARPVSKLELDEYLLRWRGELQKNASPPPAGER